jgi:hypothetical protein
VKVTSLAFWIGMDHNIFHLAGICMVWKSFLDLHPFRMDGWIVKRDRSWRNVFGRIFGKRRQKIEAAVKISKGIGVLWNNVGDDGVECFLEKYSHFMILIKGQL